MASWASSYFGGPSSGLVTEAQARLYAPTFRFTLLGGARLLGFFLVGMYCLCFATAILGLGWAVIDPADAFTSWDWWRYWLVTPAFALTPFVVYAIYQEYKTSLPPSDDSCGFVCGRPYATAVCVFTLVMTCVCVAICLAAAIATTIIDLDNCVGNPACTGVDFDSEPSWAWIMIQAGTYGCALFGILIFFTIFFIHQASNSTWAWNVQMAVQTAAEGNMTSNISSEMTSVIEQTHKYSGKAPAMAGPYSQLPVDAEAGRAFVF
jgi:hypothetical protein